MTSLRPKLEITSNGLKIYRKETFTGHYTNFSSFVPWNHRISWIRSQVYRTKRLCDRENFKEGIREVKKFASWNGFPRNVRNRLINKFVNSTSNRQTEREEDPEVITMWFNVLRRLRSKPSLRQRSSGTLHCLRTKPRC